MYCKGGEIQMFETGPVPSDKAQERGTLRLNSGRGGGLQSVEADLIAALGGSNAAPTRDSAHTWFHLGSWVGRQTRSGQQNTALSVQIPHRRRTDAQTCVWFRLLLL